VKKNPLVPLVAVVTLAVGGVIATLATSTHPLLGLDLQGGASVVLQPSRKVDPAVLDKTIGILRQRVDGLGVGESEITRQGSSIVVAVPGAKNPEEVLNILGKTAELRFRPVLQDLPSEDEIVARQLAAKSATTTTAKPGASTTAPKAGVTTTAPKAGAATSVVSAATTAVPTLTTAKSVDATTSVAALGSGPGIGRFVISAAAATTVAPATTVPTTIAPTTVAPSAVAGASKPSTTIAGKSAPTTLPAAPVVTAPPAPPVKNAVGFDLLKTTKNEDDEKDVNVILPLQKADRSASRLILGPAQMVGGVKGANASLGQNGAWEVNVELSGKGTKNFNTLAQTNCEKRVAIVLDAVVQSAPLINSPCNFPDGRVQITGNFNEKEAKALATVLKFGSLPVKLTPLTAQTVSPSLGRDSLRAGLLTGLLGLLLVAAYMLFYYRVLGLVVVSGLLVSGGLMWTVVSLLSKTQGLALSLSGTVGIIVSVGVTVDSYVVYFERLRDQIREGKSIESSVDRGFKQAWRTILAADATSFIGALVLYLLTIGSVRGFAFFLMLSTALDVIVTYFFTRNIVKFIASRNGFTGKSLGVDVLARPTTGATTTSGVLRPAGSSVTGGAK
jgi:preprotein translocase subunit SecD